MPPVEDFWDEDIVIEIEKNQQDAIGDRVLHEDPREGEEGFVWPSDEGEGGYDEEEDNKKEVGQPPVLFSLSCHSDSVGDKGRDYFRVLPVVGAK